MNTESTAPAPQPINMDNISALLARLAQIMAQEVDYLQQMKVREIEPLQNEKKWLIKAIELQLKRVQKFPELLDNITDEERRDFRELVGVFEEVREENHRRLLAAKSVNERIVKAITEVVEEHNRRPGYGKTGRTEPSTNNISVTLNEKV